MGSEVKDITDDLPFEIPDSWVWCRLNDIASISAGGTPERHNPRFWANGTIPWLKISDITSANKYIKQASEYITEEGLKNSSAKILPKGTLLYTIFATIGEVGILDFDASCNQAIAGVQLFNTAIRDYLYYYLINLQAFMMSISKGCAQFNINQKILKAVFVPLPPLAEQVRIVAKIEKFEPLIAEYDKLEQQASKLDEEIYDKLKKSILQYAIQGKLVPQDPNDEPASMLLERIRAERKAKLGKKYVDSYIYKGDDNCYYEHIAGRAQDEPVEVPFDIPDNWEWGKIKYIADTQTGTTPSTSDKSNFGDYISFVKPGDLVNGRILYNREMLSERGLNNGRLIPSNSVIMVCIGGSTGKCALTDRDISCNQQINTASPCKWVLPQYLFFFMTSDYFYKTVRANATGTATPIINRSTWENLVIPIPPLAEQKRIVAKINEIFAML